MVLSNRAEPSNMGAPGSAAVSQNSCGSAELAAWQGWGPHPGASWSWPRSLPAHAAVAILGAVGPLAAWGAGRGAAHGKWQLAPFVAKLCV